MCGRYLVEINEEELREIVTAAEKSVIGHSGRFSFTSSNGEVFPGSSAPVITGDNEVRFMTWGFPGHNRPPHINARSETAAASRTFGEAMAERRCIIPASGYFEWRALDKKNKAKYKITLSSGKAMYMAGIHSADGRFAILTRAAAGAVTEIHDRMPVIIPKSLIGAWLQESPDAIMEALTDLRFALLQTSDKQKPEQISLFK